MKVHVLAALTVGKNSDEIMNTALKALPTQESNGFCGSSLRCGQVSEDVGSLSRPAFGWETYNMKQKRRLLYFHRCIFCHRLANLEGFNNV